MADSGDLLTSLLAPPDMSASATATGQNSDADWSAADKLAQGAAAGVPAFPQAAPQAKPLVSAQQLANVNAFQQAGNTLGGGMNLTRPATPAATNPIAGAPMPPAPLNLPPSAATPMPTPQLGAAAATAPPQQSSSGIDAAIMAALNSKFPS